MNYSIEFARAIRILTNRFPVYLLILIIGMLIGIGLAVGWQFRISTPESFETNGRIYRRLVKF